MATADEPESLDLEQFSDLGDALDQLSDSRIYDDVLKAAFEDRTVTPCSLSSPRAPAPASEDYTKA